MAWICSHGGELDRWVAIDDSPANFGPQSQGLGAVLFTDPSIGFDDDASAALRAMLCVPAPKTHFCYDTGPMFKDGPFGREQVTTDGLTEGFTSSSDPSLG